mmetsp:Transcript_20838/g.34372  ORF Transcript_20838/g.34372 Transcript_20838/m.34372 type:complete len:262 (+) Transcript_20838:65-850(+)
MACSSAAALRRTLSSFATSRLSLRAASHRHLSYSGSLLGTLYSSPGTPSPDTVHFYLEEAGITERVLVEKMSILSRSPANRSEEFLKMNPMGEVPALRLADGKVLTESLVICRYLDAQHTGGAGSPLYGESAAERAETDIWVARTETKYLTPLIWAARCGPLAKFFENRTPGYIHTVISDPMGEAAKTGLIWLEAQLADGRPFLCGERFTIADIRLVVNYKFLTNVHKPMRAQADEQPAFLKYVERVAARDGAAALASKTK